MFRFFPVLVMTLAACSGNADGDAPTWHQDVAPIVQENCASCHQPDQIGPFSLESYEEAVPWATAMALQTSTRAMPPWGADNSGECGEWRDARWLTDDEIQVFEDWVSGGMLEGEPPEVPLEPPAPETLTDPDITIDFGFDYTPSGSASNPEDDYRCFVLDPGLDTDQFITAFDVEPGNPEIVHHVILWSLEDAAAQTSAEALAGTEGSYTCFGSSGVSNSNPLATWAPGTGVVHYPETTGVKIAANRKLIMQVHYHLLPEQQSDRTKVHLELADSVATEAFTYLLADGGLSVPAGQANAEYSFSFDLSQLPFDLTLWGVLPHMHQRGVSISMERNTDECLVDVPNWDFEWQQQYFYETPVQLTTSDSLTITCNYDTSDDTETVRWGDGTEDEMCLVGVVVSL